jgi:hypothetical protein
VQKVDYLNKCQEILHNSLLKELKGIAYLQNKGFTSIRMIGFYRWLAKPNTTLLLYLGPAIPKRHRQSYTYKTRRQKKKIWKSILQKRKYRYWTYEN